MRGDLWHKSAVVYSLDVETFMDSDGDGCGDFAGLVRRLDYLESLGVNTLWLAPFQPSPRRDDGYDITDYFGVDSRFGSTGDFVEFVHEAGSRGLRVMIDLVVNHTSDRHPWFRRHEIRRRRSTTGTSGRSAARPTGAAASCSRASSRRPGASTDARGSTTSTASTTSSPT